MRLVTLGAWSKPLYPVEQRLIPDEVSETFSQSDFRQDRMPGLPLKNWRGNTCFINAVVQVFVHNPYVCEGGKKHFAQTKLALPAWMIQHGFPKLAAGKGHQQALSPERQEDAHDFIRQWLDAAQQHLKGCIKQTQRTPLEYIFSWVMEDQIECQGCHYKALRYEEDMDLCLPIFKGFDQQGRPQVVPSVQEALSLFTTREVIDGDDKYSCPCCSSKHGNQVAHKGLRIYTIPNTLILPLKRFHNDPCGGIGQGHYWAYVQDACDQWWRFDDHRQAQVDIEEVVSHPDAYILWYIRNQPRIGVVDAPKGCEVWPPGTAPPSEPGVAAEEPQTLSGASVTEVAEWLIAAGSAAPVSGSCTHASVEEIVAEGGGAQAAQVGLMSPSRLPHPSGPAFDLDAWLTNVGLVPDRPERMAEVVEVPDVAPAVTLMDVSAIPFIDAPTPSPESQPMKTKVPPKATPMEAPLKVSQAAPSVINEGSCMAMLGPISTMTTPMDAAEPLGSNPADLHPVQAAAASPSVSHVRPLVEVDASTGAPAADTLRPLPTVTSVGPAVNKGSNFTLEPSSVGPVSNQATPSSLRAPPSAEAAPSALAAMSGQKRAGDTAAHQPSRAEQQTSHSTLPTAAQLPSQAVTTRSLFHYDRMFPAQTKGTDRGSRNALPRQAEAKASRHKLHNQQPPTSGRVAAADLPSNGRKEETPSAIIVQYLDGDSGLDDSMCASKQPRSWASRWTGAVRATWWACKKIAKGVLLAGALSAAAACILVEYSLTCADGDDMHHS
ncbi:hypothetical protein WJX79_002768 [Trebouxia sp. C0005]